MTVMIAVDSTSDIPQERARSLDITIIPLLVLFGDESYRDGIDLTTDEFYKKLTTSPVTPTTSAPSIGAFQEAYEDMIQRGATGILQLCLSAKLSATYSAAVQAAEMVTKEKNIPIEVVDSGQVSAAFGLPAQMLAKEAHDGASLDQLKARATSILSRVHLYAALDTLEFLRRGGRISGTAAFAGSLLQVKPLLTVRDGEVVQLERIRTRGKAFERVGQLVAKLMPLEAMAIIGSDEDTRQQLAAVVRSFWTGETNQGALGPVVGTHAGPGAGGIMGITRE
ncbi:MAG TPA: DegV family protein [Ktedonobacterales bacterium]|jgi:DegV family protein with EDD domain